MSLSTVGMATPMVSMELHISCDSEVELGKQQAQRHMLLCVACDYCCVCYVEGT